MADKLQRLEGIRYSPCNAPALRHLLEHCALDVGMSLGKGFEIVRTGYNHYNDVLPQLRDTPTYNLKAIESTKPNLSFLTRVVSIRDDQKPSADLPLVLKASPQRLDILVHDVIYLIDSHAGQRVSGINGSYEFDLAGLRGITNSHNVPLELGSRLVRYAPDVGEVRLDLANSRIKFSR